MLQAVEEPQLGPIRSLPDASEVSHQEKGIWMADGEGSPGGNEPPII